MKAENIKYHFIIALICAAIFFAAAFGVEKYAQIFAVNTRLEKTEEIRPDEKVVLSFSQPILTMAKAGKIAIEPKTGFRIRWSADKKQLLIEPESFWRPETNYRLVFFGSRSVMLTKASTAVFGFSTVKYPDVFDVYPHDGQKDVLLDIEDPIVVDFDRSTRGFFIKFFFSPDLDVAYFNNAEKTQFKLMPQGRLIRGQRYDLKIFAKYEKASDNDYREIYGGSFEVLPPPPANWEKDYAARLRQAERFTLPKIKSGKYIDINLSQQIMTIFENGKLLGSYLISSGKKGMETPRGEHQIYNKSRRTWSKKYGLYMPYWMAITPSGSYGIHELPEWPGGYKEGAGHLGTPVSHGCVRLRVGPAETVWNWTDIGTLVVVY